MQAKKQFGQNFLTRDHFAIVMADAAEMTSKDVVIEIGPGKGVLTQILLERAKKVIAVEKDRDLIPLLKERFSADIKKKKLELVEIDAREYISKGKYKVVANIPYYITGEIIRQFLESKDQPQSLTLMVQKEVAERILARDGKESLLSLSVKAYGTPSIVAKVPAGNFSPPPKVDSAVLHVANISKVFFKGMSEKDFFDILHAGFAHKRKLLIGNLSNIFPREKLETVFSKLSLDKKIRAEDVPLHSWKKITEALS
jgi:16S rRNA (adenine1518-N6/adenine1519-N6)-dimethyltransferase